MRKILSFAAGLIMMTGCAQKSQKELKEKGVAPEELKLIYITHLHPDHIGSLLKEGKVVFPNAEVYVNRVEAEAWLAMEGDRSKLAKSVLDAYKTHLHLFEAGDTLEGGVKSIATYGHTPGHTVFQKDSILVIAALIHGAALQHQKHQRPERGIFPRSFIIIPTYKNV